MTVYPISAKIWLHRPDSGPEESVAGCKTAGFLLAAADIRDGVHKAQAHTRTSRSRPRSRARMQIYARACVRGAQVRAARLKDDARCCCIDVVHERLPTNQSSRAGCLPALSVRSGDAYRLHRYVGAWVHGDAWPADSKRAQPELCSTWCPVIIYCREFASQHVEHV